MLKLCDDLKEFLTSIKLISTKLNKLDELTYIKMMQPCTLQESIHFKFEYVQRQARLHDTMNLEWSITNRKGHW